MGYVIEKKTEPPEEGLPELAEGQQGEDESVENVLVPCKIKKNTLERFFHRASVIM